MRTLISRESSAWISEHSADRERRISSLVDAVSRLPENDSCPCGKDHGYPITSCDRFEIPVSYSLCSSCGTLFRRHAWPTDKENAGTVLSPNTLFEIAYSQASPQALLRRERALGHAVYCAVASFLTDGSKVVDIDSLTGGSLIPFDVKGMSTCGVGPFDQLLSEGATYNLNVEQVFDLCSRINRVRGAHLLFAGNLLLCSPSPSSLLTELSQKLSPGAFLGFHHFDFTSIQRDYASDILSFLRYDHRQYFSNTLLSKLVLEAGCHIVHLDTVHQIVVVQRDGSPQQQTAKTIALEPDTPKQRMTAVAGNEKAYLLAGGAQGKPSLDAESPRPSSQYFFCLGVQKTGTTLLARMLDQHPDIACMCETYLPMPSLPGCLLNTAEDSWQRHGFAKERLSPWFDRLLISVSGRNRQQDLITGRDDRFFAALGDVMREVFEDFGRRCGAQLVGDKWPWYIDYLDLLETEFPQAKLIYTVRDPRAVWNSAERFQDKRRGDAVIKELLSKDRRFERMRDAGHVITIKFEDLIEHPNAARKRLFQFLGCSDEIADEPYSTSNDPYPMRWKWIPETYGSVDLQHVDKWKNQMSAKQIVYVQNLCGTYMEKYGYC